MTFLNKLVDKGILKKEDVSEIFDVVSKTERTVNQVLKGRGIDEKDILAARSEFNGVPIMDCKDITVKSEVLKYIPEESAKHYGVIPIDYVDEVLKVGMTDPDDIEARDALQFISTQTRVPFSIFLISQGDFESIFESYKGLSGTVSKALSELGGDSETLLNDVQVGIEE